MIKPTAWADLKNDVVYYDLPKCASTSLIQALQSIPGTAWQEVPRNLEFVLGKSFTVVRNPYDRLVSLYENRVRSSDAPSGKAFRDRYGLSKAASFHEFLTAILYSDRKTWDEHFEPQVEQVPFAITWYPFEGLGEAWLRICWRFYGIKFKDAPVLPHRAATRRKDWRDYYTDPFWLDTVYDLYRADFERFGYRKGVDSD